MIQIQQNRSIALALSGGAVRAAAHIGAVKALKEAGYTISAVSGSSAGAMVGYLIASGMPIDDMVAFISSLRRRDIFHLSFKPGIFKLDRLEQKLATLGTKRYHNELDIPLYCAVSDIADAEVIYLNSGDAIKNAIASSALSPIFSPVEIENSRYIDGGFRDNLPVAPLKRYNIPIVGVDVNSMPKREITGPFTLTLHTVMVMLRGTSIGSSKMCDAYIRLESVCDMPLFDISLVSSAVELGYREMRDRIKEIEDAIS